VGALADIFTAIHYTLDGTGFEAQALAIADKSGKNMGKTLEDRLNGAIKKALQGAAGAATGFAFATAINGATKLNELAGEYQVQTGASAEEAKAFSGVLNNLFENAHQGYDEIAQTLIGLKTHFDLSGQAAATLGATVLDFAEIAGGTGADAVERLNSLVKTGVITQADMSATMDKLTLAHQKWGININETLDSLTKFAPAMNALGMSTDEAIGWMSMFNKAGVDSQRVVMGFNTAIKNFKTPAEFQAFLAKLAATPDDFERAQLASSVFGQRVGAVMANMIKPGTQSIADMAKIIGTDYVGSVAAAAKVNDNTFGGQALLLMHKFQGALADIGANAGPLLTVFSLLGPQWTRTILTSMGAISGMLIPKIAAQLGLTLPTWIAAGTASGAASVAAETATVAAGQAGVAAAAAPAAAAAGTSIGSAMGLAAGAAMIAAIPLAFLAAWNEAGNQVKAINKEAQPKWNMNKPFEPVVGHGSALADINKPIADARAAQAAIDKALADQMAADGALIDQAGKDGYSGIPTAAQAAMYEANLKIQQGLDNDVKTIQGKRSALAAAWSDAMNTVVSAQTIGYRLQSNAADIADNARQIADKKAWKKLTTQQRDALLEQRVQLRANRIALIEEDTNYGTNAQKAAKMAGLLQSQALKDGLASTDPDTVTMWQKVQADTQTALDQVSGIMNTGGQNAAAALALGLAAKLGKGWIINSDGSATKITIKAFDVGTPFVERDQLAFIHKGERIVPAAENAALSRGEATLGGVTQIFNFPHYVGSRSELTKAITEELRLVGA
jgi:hypothetical protein